MYKHAVHDGQSFYVIQDTGALCWFRDTANNGTPQWAPNTGNQIGTGWGSVTLFMAGSNPGELYAVDADGNLRWYRDLLCNGSNAANGTSGWAPHSGSIIGYGWNQYIHIFPGPHGVIYAVKPTGELMWYQYTAGAPLPGPWANTGLPKQIGQGWQTAKRIVACRQTAPPQSFNDYVIYVVKQGGGLFWYHDDLSTGLNQPNGHTGWAQNSGKQIGTQWDQAADVIGAAHGVLYLVRSDGALCWYRDILGDGENDPNGHTGWAPQSGGQIGNGWFPEGGVPPVLPASQTWQANISFSDSTPLGGSITLTLQANGEYSFSGHMHDSGFDPISFTVVAVVASPASTIVPAFAFSGKSGGTTGGGSRDCDWDGSATSIFKDQNGATVPNPNPAIQQNWAALCHGSLTWNCTSQDLTASGALDFAGQVAVNVIAGFAEKGISALAVLLVG